MTPPASPAPPPPCLVPVQARCPRSQTALRSRTSCVPLHRPDPNRPISLVLSACLSIPLVVTPNEVRVLALPQRQVIAEQLQRHDRCDWTQYLRHAGWKEKTVAVLKRFAVLLSQKHQRHCADLQHRAS